MHRFFFLFYFILFYLSYESQAQIFSGTKPQIDWQQINIPQAQIIYPSQTDSIAKRIADNIRLIQTEAQMTIGGKFKKVPVVLRNSGLVSNGYVSLSPFRSEFYLTAPQNPFELGSIPWPDLLSAHEYRHVQQYSNFDVGLSHVMKSIFGQSGQALANAASVPDWFFEGDAVYQETNFTKQGRGSLPYFYNGFRGLWRGEKNYTWMKLRNGSLRDFVPDKYILGFMLTAYGREKHGIMFWNKITHDAASFSSLFYPFQTALKQQSGMKFSRFRDSAFQFFKDQFKDSILFSPKPDFYLNEEFPHFTNTGDLIYLRSSVKSIPAFYLRKNKKEIKIRVADYMTENYFSYRNGKIVYASRRADLRWGYRAYNEIQLLDVKTGKQQRITKGSRYFSPDINEDGSKIVAVNLSTSGRASLHILDVSDGKAIKELRVNGAINYAYPKIYGDSIFACVTDTLGRMSLEFFDTRNDKSETLLPFSFNVIGFPLLRNDTLFFSISYLTNDELFALTMKERKLFLISSKQGSIGKYHVAANNEELAWSTFTAQGRRIQRVPVAALSFREISLTSFSRHTSSFRLMNINNVNANLIYRKADTPVVAKKYAALSHPFNFHSIIPGMDDPVYSIALTGENILNTIQSSVSLSYDRSNHSKTIGGNIAYGRWFPVITGGLNYHFDRRFLRKDTFVYYNSIEPYAGFYIPLNLSRGRHFTTATFGSNLLYNKTTFQRPFQKKYKDYTYSYLSNYFSFANQSQVSTAQVLPRFGQSLYLNYKFPISNISGFQWLSTARIFLPGFAATHSFNLAASYAQKDTLKQISFSSAFPFARGYEAVNLWRMKGVQLNYQLPVAFPDWGFADLVYFLRIRANFFYDHTFAKVTTQLSRTFRSAGCEVFFDTKWWNQVPVSFGVRYARLLDTDIYGPVGINRWEVVLPVNIFNQ